MEMMYTLWIAIVIYSYVTVFYLCICIYYMEVDRENKIRLLLNRTYREKKMDSIV